MSTEYYSDKKAVDSLYEHFASMIERFSSSLKDKDDKYIEYHVFEDGYIFDIIFDYYPDELYDLVEHWLISEGIYQKTLEFANKIRRVSITERKKWTVDSVRNDDEWREIMILADEIKAELLSD